MQIIILGMHRSGTSLTTRLINMMGVYFGPEKSAGEITNDNPKGFWERPEVFKLNEAIMAAKGCTWRDVGLWEENTTQPPDNLLKNIPKILIGMDAFRPWLLKDPRLCLTLPYWRPYLEVPIAVIVHRDPVEIAISLHKRDGLPLDRSIALWESYASGIMRNTQDIPRIHVSHHDLLSRPVDACHQLYLQLVEQGVRRIEMPSEREITAFIDPKLYRSKPAGTSITLTPAQMQLDEKMAGTVP